MTSSTLRRRHHMRGFTLLEVMVALAILAMSMVVLLEILTNNVRATNHAKMITAATFLARGKMIQVEQDVLDTGFSDNDEEDEGNFEEEGFPTFRWHSLIEKVELPANAATMTQQAAGEEAQTGNPMDAMQGMLGGMMSMIIEPIRLGLEASVRRVTVSVYWDEFGRPNQSMELVMFMTDPSRLDMAMGGLAAGAAGAGTGGSGAAGASGGGGTGGSGQGGSGRGGSGLGGPGLGGSGRGGQP